MRVASIVLLLALAPMHALAQDQATPSDVTLGEAQALFRHAVELGDQDRWAEALELFRRSLTLAPRPSTEFNVGFALFRLGHFGEAIATFDSYLAATEGETSELRTEAVTRRGQAIANLATLTLEVEPGDATVRVDGERVASTGSPRMLTLDPGRHLLLGSAVDHEDAQLEISLLSAEQRTERLVLASIARAEVTPPTTTHDTSLVDDPIFWVVTGAIALAIGVGVGVGVAVATSGTTAPYPGSTGVVLQMP